MRCGNCTHWIPRCAQAAYGLCDRQHYTAWLLLTHEPPACDDFEDVARLVSAAVRQQSAARGDVSGLARQMAGGKP